MTNDEHRKLFEEHWEGYTKPLMDACLDGGPIDFTNKQWELVKFLCLTHWLHGAKHERDAK